jgi:hypothetical protein
MKTGAISQPRYLPALIYLQRMKLADVFVLLDDVQHSREFENRNYIKTPQGKKWLTINCLKGRMKICELRIGNPSWIEEHKELIRRSYRKAPFFSEETLDFIYNLQFNESFTETVERYLRNCMSLLDIKTELLFSSTLGTESKGAEKLAEISTMLGFDVYLSGINGREYIENEFADCGVKVKYHTYEHPVYPQLWGDFIPWMGVIDTLFNVGLERTKEMLDENCTITD